MGKYDFKPGYECPDEKTGKMAAFDLGTDWKPITFSRPVCMKNRVTGVINNDCIKYESGNDGPKYLSIVKETGKHIVLDGQWEPLSLDDPICEPVKMGTDDPPKDFEFAIVSDLEKPAAKDGGK